MRVAISLHSFDKSNLGLGLQILIGVERDVERAVVLDKEAEDEVNTPYKCSLCVGLQSTIGMERSVRRAVALYKEVADQSDAMGKKNMGLCRENGIGWGRYVGRVNIVNGSVTVIGLVMGVRRSCFHRWEFIGQMQGLEPEYVHGKGF